MQLQTLGLHESDTCITQAQTTPTKAPETGLRETGMSPISNSIYMAALQNAPQPLLATEKGLGNNKSNEVLCSSPPKTPGLDRQSPEPTKSTQYSGCWAGAGETAGRFLISEVMEAPSGETLSMKVLGSAICNGSSGPLDMNKFSHPQSLTIEDVHTVWSVPRNAEEGVPREVQLSELAADAVKKEETGIITLTIQPKAAAIISRVHNILGKASTGKNNTPINLSKAKIALELRKTQESLPTAEKAAKEAEETLRKWQGTSTRYHKGWLQSIAFEKVSFLIRVHGEAFNEVRTDPYHPQSWLTLSLACQALHFSEIQIQCAYNALLLCKSGLGLDLPHSLAVDHLQNKVCAAVYHKMVPRLNLKPLIDVYLQQLHHAAWCALLEGMMDAEALFEGLQELKNAEKAFPGDKEIGELECTLKCLMLVQMEDYVDSPLSERDKEHLIKVGRVFKRQYPWVSQSLFVRTPEMVDNFNKELRSPFCEIRPLVPKYNSVVKNNTEAAASSFEDVGPLGLFATRAMKSGTIVFIDHSTTCGSSIQPSNLTHCDACHSSLDPIHLPPVEVITASCCNKTKYCSQKCHDYATGPDGYHTVACDEDLSWIYALDIVNHESTMTLLTMHRMISTILAEQRHAERMAKDCSTPFVLTHPLQHPLLARLTAGYSQDTLNPLEIDHEWSYIFNIVSPTRILSSLGVDIFADPIWGGAGELNHTVWWRIYNNFCAAHSLELQSGILDRNGTFRPSDGEVEGDILMPKDVPLSGIMKNFIFFNHACKPNVDWISAGPAEMMGSLSGGATDKGKKRGQGVSLQVGVGKKRKMEWIKAGEAHMVCRLLRDVDAGEELRISYLPGKENERGLAKWFENGCECDDSIVKTQRGDGGEDCEMGGI